MFSLPVDIKLKGNEEENCDAAKNPWTVSCGDFIWIGSLTVSLGELLFKDKTMIRKYKCSINQCQPEVKYT